MEWENLDIFNSKGCSKKLQSGDGSFNLSGVVAGDGGSANDSELNN